MIPRISTVIKILTLETGPGDVYTLLEDSLVIQNGGRNGMNNGGRNGIEKGG